MKARGEQLRGRLRERYAEHPLSATFADGGFLSASNSSGIARANRRSTDDEAARGIRSEALQRGLMVYPMGGTVDGSIGDHVLLAPPFICTARDIERSSSRLADAIDGAH